MTWKKCKLTGVSFQNLPQTFPNKKKRTNQFNEKPWIYLKFKATDHILRPSPTCCSLNAVFALHITNKTTVTTVVPLQYTLPNENLSCAISKENISPLQIFENPPRWLCLHLFESAPKNKKSEHSSLWIEWPLALPLHKLEGEHSKSSFIMYIYVNAMWVYSARSRSLLLSLALISVQPRGMCLDSSRG